MKRKYFHELRNKKVLEFLIREENLPVIAQFIHEEAAKLLELNKIKDNFDLGERFDEEGLKQVLLEVKAEVDSFLEVDNIPVPECIYYDRSKHHKPDVYQPFNRRIIADKHPLVKLVSTLSHEYAHHVQTELNVPRLRCSAFKEGHARGVQRIITHQYMEKESNEAFVYDVTKSTFKELMRSYGWICSKLKQVPPKRKLSNHSAGCTFMYLIEAVHGNRVYKDVLERNLVFNA